VLVPNVYYRHGPAPATELPEHIGEDVRPAVIARLMPLIDAHTTGRVLRDADVDGMTAEVHHSIALRSRPGGAFPGGG
jgi:hypothetical protein